MVSRFNTFFLAISSLMLTWTTAACGDDWYRFRGPQLDGISRERIDPDSWLDTDGETPRAPVLWRQSVGAGMSGVVVHRGLLYTMGNEDNVDTVYCFDVADGKVRWQYSYECATDPNEFEGGPTATPTIDVGNSVVYTLSRVGNLYCFDADDGDVRWSQEVPELANVRIPAWGYSGSPLVLDDLLLLNVGDAGVALHKETGKLVWASEDKDAGYSSFVPVKQSGEDAIILGSARSYVCINPRNGNELWRERWLTTFGCNAADAIVSGDRVFLSSAYNRGGALFQLTDEDPTIVWKSKEMQNHISTSVLIDGHLYGIHGGIDTGANLRCIRFSDGEIQWTSADIRFGAIAATQQHLITLSDDGELIIAAADPKSFQLVSRQRVVDDRGWVAPVLSNGQIFCRGAGGDLVSLAATE